jgi:hypothetical protein
MSMDSDLYTYLSTYASLTALVGIRIYPVECVPKTCPLPYVTYECVDNPGIHLMGGDADLHSPTYEINVFSSTMGVLKSIEVVVVAALQDYRGTMGSTVVQRIFYEDSIYNEYDPDIGTYSQTVIFTIWHV